MNVEGGRREGDEGKNEAASVTSWRYSRRQTKLRLANTLAFTADCAVAHLCTIDSLVYESLLNIQPYMVQTITLICRDILAHCVIRNGTEREVQGPFTASPQR